MHAAQHRQDPGGRRRPSSLLRRALSVLATVALIAVVVGSVAAAGRIGYVGYGAHDAAGLASEQLRWLEPRLTAVAPAPADQDVPDGPVLQVAVTALATAGDTARPVAVRLPVLRAALARLRAPALRAPYATSAQPQDGAFLQGWTLLVAVEVARCSGEERDKAVVRDLASPLVPALASVSSGVLPSYRDVYRPVDTVVLAAALRRADSVAHVGGVDAAVQSWLPRLTPLRDPTTQLLAHRTDAAGRLVDGPRASSQALIQTFWPSIDLGATTSSRDWVAFENTFLCPRLGLVAVCEYPGGAGAGDAGSGPLVAGVSPVATVLTLGAARTHGNAALADQISREAELFGGPIVDDAGRHYAAGAAPTADALLAWARTVPVAAELPGVDDRDGVAWSAWALCALIPAVLALGAMAWRVLGRRRFSGPLDSDAAPPTPPYGGSGGGRSTAATPETGATPAAGPSADW